MIRLLNKIGATLNQITNGNTLGKVGIYLGSVLTAFFAPIGGLLITCFAATIIDMIYGIRVARKYKKKIESRKNWKGTLVKLIDEFWLIVLSRLVEFTVLGTEGVFVLTGGVTIIIALTEIWSIIENLNTLDPDGPWRVLGKFLKKKGEDYVGIKLDLTKGKHVRRNTQSNKEP